MEIVVIDHMFTVIIFKKHSKYTYLLNIEGCVMVWLYSALVTLEDFKLYSSYYVPGTMLVLKKNKNLLSDTIGTSKWMEKVSWNEEF